MISRFQRACTPRRAAIRSCVLVVLGAMCTVSTSAALGQPAAQQAPKAFVQQLHHKLDGLVVKHRALAPLHAAIGKHLIERMDFHHMSERILGNATWKSLKKPRRNEFLGLLQKMLQRTYVKRFKPGQRVQVRYQDKVRAGKSGRVQVRTEIKVKRTRAEVWYSMLPVQQSWRIYDIVVDEASQLRTYRRSFRKVLKKDGWDALIARMNKSARRK